MGVKTKVFGKYAWLVLEGVAKFYDEYMVSEATKKEKLEMQTLFKEFFFLLAFVLPCVYCRISYREFTSTEIKIEHYLNKPDGGKKFVYDLHCRVTKKLWDQEREDHKNDPKALSKINIKWNAYNISYETALREKYPSTESYRFWNAVIIFLALIMCDYRDEEVNSIYRFFCSIGFILNRKSTELSRAYLSGLSKTLPIWDRLEKDLATRLDIVWVIKNAVFAVKDWEFPTRSDFDKKCRSAIVGCVT